MATSSSKRSPAKRSAAKSSPKSTAKSSASGRRSVGERDERGPAKPDPGARAGATKKAAKRKSSRSKPIHDHTASPREEQDGVRLQKFLASAGLASRRHAEELIRSGQVQVNGRVITELGTRVFGDRDRVTVRGDLVVPEAKVYYVLNKPDAIVCSAAGSVDERGRPTVLSLMHGIRERLYPVGRLDYHSRGVVLLTNDGELAEALTHPRHGVVKTYHVKFQGKLSGDEEQALRDGVVLDDGTITRPLAELFGFRETGSNVWYQMGLTEGINRQIRRMGDAIDHPVLKLIRVAIGDITADELDEGQYRPLKPTEVAQLLAAVRVAPEPTRKPSVANPAGPKKASRRPFGGNKAGVPAPAGARRSSESRAGSGSAKAAARAPAGAKKSPRAAEGRSTSPNAGAKKTSGARSAASPSAGKTGPSGAKRAPARPTGTPSSKKASRPTRK